jgi:hypothetical protein
VPFPYYRRLSARNKAIYRRSDALADLKVPEPEALRPAVADVAAALESGTRRSVARATQRLVDAILGQLEVSAVMIKVLAVRPSDATSELHGLYEFEEDEIPLITVWMQTAVHGNVVAFRSFLRTVLHELCHHLDYVHFELEDSFHTEGFFRRESALARQLLPPKKRETKRKSAAEPKESPAVAGTGQLDLFW